MTIRFLADEDIDPSIVHGLRTREPAIDILDIKAAGLRGMKDPVLLDLAERQGRNLISYDRRTMTRHLRERIHNGKSTPGVFLVPQSKDTIGESIEWLLLVWAASEAAEWSNRIVYVPMR